MAGERFYPLPLQLPFRPRLPGNTDELRLRRLTAPRTQRGPAPHPGLVCDAAGALSAQVIADWDEQDELKQADPTPQLRHMPTVYEGEEVIVMGAALGSDDPLEQAQIDFHKAEK